MRRVIPSRPSMVPGFAPLSCVAPLAGAALLLLFGSVATASLRGVNGILPEDDSDPAVALARPFERVGAFSGTILLERRGHGAWSRSAGTTRGAFGGGAMGPDTLARVGSVTKSFTGEAILSLEREGKLRLDTPVSSFFPEVDPSRLAREREILRVRHLLDHTGALASFALLRHGNTVSDFDGFAPRILEEGLSARPGSVVRYSNEGYIVLRAIVERAGGEPFDRALARRAFRPAAMAGAARFVESGSDGSESSEGAPGGVRARGLCSLPGALVPMFLCWRPFYASDSDTGGAGGSWASARDLLAWVRHARDRGDSAASLVLAGQGAADAAGTRMFAGWVASTGQAGGQVAWHNGLDGSDGYSSFIGFDPASNRFAVAVLNVAPAGRRIDVITSRLIHWLESGESPPATVTEQQSRSARAGWGDTVAPVVRAASFLAGVVIAFLSLRATWASHKAREGACSAVRGSRWPGAHEPFGEARILADGRIAERLPGALWIGALIVVLVAPVSPAAGVAAGLAHFVARISTPPRRAVPGVLGEPARPPTSVLRIAFRIGVALIAACLLLAIASVRSQSFAAFSHVAYGE